LRVPVLPPRATASSSSDWTYSPSESAIARGTRALQVRCEAVILQDEVRERICKSLQLFQLCRSFLIRHGEGARCSQSLMLCDAANTAHELSWSRRGQAQIM
jgi:hypothetical protein